MMASCCAVTKPTSKVKHVQLNSLDRLSCVQPFESLSKPFLNCIETDMFQMMCLFVLRSTLLLQHLVAMFDSTARQPLLQALLHMVSDIALKA